LVGKEEPTPAQLTRDEGESAEDDEEASEEASSSSEDEHQRQRAREARKAKKEEKRQRRREKRERKKIASAAKLAKSRPRSPSHERETEAEKPAKKMAIGAGDAPPQPVEVTRPTPTGPALTTAASTAVSTSGATAAPGSAAGGLPQAELLQFFASLNSRMQGLEERMATSPAGGPQYHALAPEGGFGSNNVFAGAYIVRGQPSSRPEDASQFIICRNVQQTGQYVGQFCGWPNRDPQARFCSICGGALTAKGKR